MQVTKSKFDKKKSEHEVMKSRRPNLCTARIFKMYEPVSRVWHSIAKLNDTV